MLLPQGGNKQKAYNTSIENRRLAAEVWIRAAQLYEAEAAKHRKAAEDHRKAAEVHEKASDATKDRVGFKTSPHVQRLIALFVS